MKIHRIKDQARELLLGLGIQFLLGIWVSLFVKFPDATDPHQHWKFALAQVSVLSHLVVGTLLVLGALGLVIRFSRLKADRFLRAASGIGFGAIVLAWASGERFVTTQKDGFSFTMAVFFLIAAGAYIAILSRSDNGQSVGNSSKSAK